MSTEEKFNQAEGAIKEAVEGAIEGVKNMVKKDDK